MKRKWWEGWNGKWRHQVRWPGNRGASSIWSGYSHLVQNGTGFYLQTLSQHITLLCLIIFIFVYLHVAIKQYGLSQNKICCLPSVNWAGFISLSWIPFSQINAFIIDHVCWWGKRPTSITSIDSLLLVSVSLILSCLFVFNCFTSK